MKSKPIIIDFETWCKLCDALNVHPEISVNGVIRMIKLKGKWLTKYRKEIFKNNK